MERINIVLADDQRLFVDNLKIVLESRTKDIRVLGIAYGGREAVSLCDSLKPDMVLLDVRMPDLDGVEAAKRINAARPGIKIIMLTTFDDDLYVHQALHQGASGYILKNVSPTELINSIRAVHGGSILISPSAAERLIHREAPQKGGERAVEDLEGLLDSLTSREMQIVKLIALAYDNRQIAERLAIAEQTVKNSLSVIYSKFGVSKRTQLMRIFEACKQRGLSG
jgi:DNA-binding NarL/FixJ family response regulator